MPRSIRIRSLLLVAVIGLSLSSPGRAQNMGFQINRFEPTPAGEWSFLVDHPWYSSTRYFAGGLTFNYAHDPLVYSLVMADRSYQSAGLIIEHQLITHVDLAAAFWDRLNISVTLPVVLHEEGTELAKITPQGTPTVGDPRLGFMVRLYGQPDRSRFSIHLGADLFIPLRSGFSDNLPQQESDEQWRAIGKVVMAGFDRSLRWSLSTGYMYRQQAFVGHPSLEIGADQELQLGLGLYYASQQRRFSVGTEALLATFAAGSKSFQADGTSLEVLIGAHYNIAHRFQVGAAVSHGFLSEPLAGTPDWRAVLRLAYAPLCDPEVKTASTTTKRTSGLSPGAGPVEPSPPIADRDHDGIADNDDQCPDEPQGAHPDRRRPGCPLPDRDHDGVPDVDDKCIDLPEGPRHNEQRPGCPVGDLDRDGVLDPDDRCIDLHAGLHPDPKRPGCPMLDLDQDGVPDVIDACPQQPGAPSTDARKNGCPGLVRVRRGQILLLEPVPFAPDKGTILPAGQKVLDALADALRADPAIRRVSIEVHTDASKPGKHDAELSEQRARSVMKRLINAEINPARLAAKGDVARRKTDRLIEVRIVDPPSAELPP